MLCTAALAPLCGRMIIKMLCLLSVALVLTEAHAEVITVCGSGCDYTNISAGINAAYPGQTVEVHSGRYVENVIVKKPVILMGKDTGNDKPVIDANSRGNGVTIGEDGVVLKGFEIRNSRGNPFELRAGIYVDSNDNRIEDNSVIDNENGIFIEDVNNNSVMGNWILNNKYGIKIVYSRYNTINLNNISSNLDNRYKNNQGLLLSNSRKNSLAGNEISHNYYGLMLKSSEGNTLRNNNIYDNKFNFGADEENDIDASNFVDFKPIYFFRDISSFVIDSSSNCGALYCFDCDNITIKDMSLTNNLFGIYFYNTTNSTLTNISLVNNSYGMRMIASRGNSIAKCDVNSSYMDGISLTACEGNLLESNLIRNAGNFGMNISESTRNTISNNRIIDNSNGLEVIWSKDNSLIKNNVSLNKNIGIYFGMADFSNISYNELIGNSVSMLLYSSWYNNIAGNLIQRNRKGVQITSSNENSLLNNTIFSNGVAITKDLFDNNTCKNIVIDNEKDEDIILPGTTGSFPGTIIVGDPISINVDSNPNKAIVYIDGSRRGMTNLTISIFEGQHELGLSWKDDYYNESFNTATKTEFVINRIKSSQ
jgi:parallel beta-helix repeat protein